MTACCASFSVLSSPSSRWALTPKPRPVPAAEAGNVATVEDLETAAFSTHLAAGLTYKLAANTSAYLYYSRSLNTTNLAVKPNGAEVNAVHSTDVWSLGLTHSF